MYKKITLPLFVLLLLASCSQPSSDNDDSGEETAEVVTQTETVEIEDEPQVEARVGKIMLYVKLKTSLTEEEMTKRAHAREPEFEALPGLVQKYYIKTGNEGEFGGVYIWDSEESLEEYKNSDLRKSIAEAYDAIEPPQIERVDIMFQLRE